MTKKQGSKMRRKRLIGSVFAVLAFLSFVGAMICFVALREWNTYASVFSASAFVCMVVSSHFLADKEKAIKKLSPDSVLRQKIERDIGLKQNSDTGTGVTQTLRELKRLLDAGLITAEDYEEQKDALLLELRLARKGAALKCPCCGADMTETEDKQHGKCEYCGTVMKL